MKRQLIFVLAIVMVASLVPVCEAGPVQWRIEDGGNGHYYEVVDMGTSDNWFTWEEAKAAAEAASYLGVPGHLATITSVEEEQFIIDNLLTPPYGSWALGGHQPVNPETAPDEGWEWITGETWDYTNWQWAEPWSPPGVDEDALDLAWRGAPGNKIWGWQDIEYTTKDNGYIIEYPVCQPACELIPEEIASMGVAHNGAGVVSYDGKLYVWTGYTNYGPKHYNRTPKMEIYNPDANTWEDGNDIPKVKSYLASFELNGKIYTVGGETNPSGSFTRTVHRYSPDEDSWEQMNDFPRNMWQGQGTSVVCNGKAYVFGGVTGYGNPLSSVYEYDEANDAWIPKSPMPTGVCAAAAVCFKNQIWVLGGTASNHPTVITKEVQIYDPATDTWAYGDEMPWKVLDSQAIVYNNDIWIFANSVWDEDTGDWIQNEYAYKFSPESGEWTICGFTFTPPIKPNYGSKLGLLNGYVYFTDIYENGSGSERAFKVALPEPARYFVDGDAPGANDGSSWEDAFNYLQDALAVASSGDQIWVAEGIYKPDEDTTYPDGSSDREATFQLISGVAIYGGYAGFGELDPNARNIDLYETILSGDLNDNDEPDFGNNGENSYHVVTGADNAVLDGFTITGGNADSSVGEASSGAGMICDGVSPTISNCTFRDNNAYWGGGGMLNHNNSSPILTNCTFSGNSAEEYSGGGVRNYESHPTFINCTFSGNESYYRGGGMQNYRSGPKLINCIFSENLSFLGGGVCNLLCSPTFINCVFSENSASYDGGGMRNHDYSDPVLINCTFFNNTASHCGGGMDNLSYSEARIINCIFWGNTDNDGVNMDESAQICDHGQISDVSYSCIQVLDDFDIGGKNNIGDDPCFVEPGNGDYHLLVGSPCIDAGDNWAVPADTTDLDGDGNTTEPIPWDLDGNPRIVDGNDDGVAVVDMGAYEFFNTAPIADAGPNQVAYAWIDGIAEVVLDGNDSNDPDGDELTYLWSWTIGPTTYETNSVSPAIELPVGEHIIELIVNDGTEDSEPDEVTITVIEPMESRLWIFPQVINRRSRQRKILAWLRLPEGITRDQIDSNEPLLLYPDVPEANGIEAIHQYVFQNRRRRSQHTSILAFFDKAELMDAVGDDGRVELQVVGNLRTGQYFYGTDTVWITDWRRLRSLRHR